MTPDVAATKLWREMADAPKALARTLALADGHAELATLLGAPHVRRIVATGNGASWYVAMVFWLAALAARSALDVVAVPAGLVARGTFPWRDGDVLLAFSSSGALRDLVEATADEHCPRPFGLVTANAESPDTALTA